MSAKANTSTENSTSARVAGVAHEAVDRVAETAEQAEQRLREGARHAETRVRESGAQARARAEDVADTVSATVRKHPFATLGVAFLAGVIVSAVMRR